jgi:hypothetical protein
MHIKVVLLQLQASFINDELAGLTIETQLHYVHVRRLQSMIRDGAASNSSDYELVKLSNGCRVNDTNSCSWKYDFKPQDFSPHE